jgi:dihydropteroate synthase
MGILNITPDSFFDGGRYNKESEVFNRVEAMVEEGASIIDIGGYSTRPGSLDVSLEDELSRVIKFFSPIKKLFPTVLLSIDTFRAEVARQAVESGADIINDISGGTMDNEMFSMVARLKVPYILTHMKGTPQDMIKHAVYENILLEMTDYFQERIAMLRGMGVNEIMIDPGFGFAKTIDQNYHLLKNLNYFKIFNLPILVGISRKSMIHKKLNIDPGEALNGTSALNTIALMNGADILRVHDVKEAKEVIKLFKSVYP